jgi:hypothetical protein
MTGGLYSTATEIFVTQFTKLVDPAQGINGFRQADLELISGEK